jgi:Lon protease-like protein
MHYTDPDGAARLDNLPLFPLHTVLFPGALLPLHVFEERYKEMVADCLGGDPRFGVLLISRGWEVGATPEVYSIGCTARIVRVGRYEDGRMDLVTVGMHRFRVLAVNHEKPYLRADVEFLRDRRAGEEGLSATVARIRELIHDLRAPLGLPDDPHGDLPDDPVALSFIAGGLDLPLHEKQRILESTSTRERLERLEALLQRETELLHQLGPTRPVAGMRRLSPN